MTLASPMVSRWVQDGLRDPGGVLGARGAGPALVPRAGTASSSGTTPTFRWFVGAETNLAYNALDRHVAAGRGGHAALVYLNERGERAVFTYAQLLHEVKRLAAALRGLGVGKGDRITIYMPTVARSDRADAGDGAHRRDSLGRLRGLRREGARRSHSRPAARGASSRPTSPTARARTSAEGDRRRGALQRRRGELRRARRRAGSGAAMSRCRCAGPRHHRGTRSSPAAAGQTATYERMEANEPAFILATSGTTAKPKLAIHTHGGYQVHIIEHGPLVLRSEARPTCGGRRPTSAGSSATATWSTRRCSPAARRSCSKARSTIRTPEANWRVVVEEFGATGIFTSPTAVRTLMKYGDGPLRERRSRAARARGLRRRSAQSGRRWDWLQNTILERPHSGHRSHVADRDRRAGVRQSRTGSACCRSSRARPTIPLPGIEAAVVTPDGRAVRAGRKGHHGAEAAVSRTDAGALGRAGALRPRLLGEDSRRLLHRRLGARRRGRLRLVRRPRRRDHQDRRAPHRHDRSGERVPQHPAVAECGVIGRPDETRGEVISAFVLLKHGHAASPELRQALLETVRRELGPVAVIGELNFVSMLPKTRSGKIMRRVLKAVTLDRDPGDITTIEDEGSVDEARQAWQQMKAEMQRR